MKQAIAELRNKGFREVERAWQVPKDTLARRVKGDGLEAGWKHASGKKPILPQQAERELVELVMMLSKRGFPLRRKHVQRLAFEYMQLSMVSEDSTPLKAVLPVIGSRGSYQETQSIA